METLFEAKDLRRLQDIKNQPGKEFGLATKQSKLIKDANKAHRRHEASMVVFGGSHVVTNIFWRRYQELVGTMVATPTTKVIVEPKNVEPTTVEPEVENRITRKQEDFPIGCKVKIEERKGKVLQHDELDKESIMVEFEDGTENVNIYSLKRC